MDSEPVSYLRFTPVYILVIGFMATLYVFLADGPFSGFMYHASRNCESNGWKNMLYVNNLVNATMENMVSQTLILIHFAEILFQIFIFLCSVFQILGISE